MTKAPHFLTSVVSFLASAFAVLNVISLEKGDSETES
ncbi:cytochrome bd-I oxidase subunit CydX [Vibrio sp. 10N.261.51.F11]